MNGKELNALLDTLATERKIPREAIVASIKDAIAMAYKREVDPEANIEVEIDATTGDISVFNLLKVVNSEDLDDELVQISLEDARKLDIKLGLNDFYRKPVPFSDFSRIAALHVKQMIKQKFTEVQKEVVHEEWAPKIGTIITAQVEKVDPENGSILVDLGSSLFGFVTPQGTIPGEVIEPGKMYKFYVQDIKQSSRGWPISLSRSAPGFVKYLMTVETPEIQDGSIEIMAVARNAGERSKIAVKSNNPSIDPIGAIVGKKGSRINAISSQLKNEKIDAVLWDEDPIKFIVNAMSPSQVVGVSVLEDSDLIKDAYVIVPDDQLSLAIGKKGSAARLAAKLTGWNLDIKSVSQAKEEGIEYTENGNAHIAKKERNQSTMFRTPTAAPSNSDRSNAGGARQFGAANQGRKRSFNIDDYKVDYFDGGSVRDSTKIQNLDSLQPMTSEPVKKPVVAAAEPKTEKEKKFSQRDLMERLDRSQAMQARDVNVPVASDKQPDLKKAERTPAKAKKRSYEEIEGITSTPVVANPAPIINDDADDFDDLYEEE